MISWRCVFCRVLLSLAANWIDYFFWLWTKPFVTHWCLPTRDFHKPCKTSMFSLMSRDKGKWKIMDFFHNMLGRFSLVNIWSAIRSFFQQPSRAKWVHPLGSSPLVHHRWWPGGGEEHDARFLGVLHIGLSGWLLSWPRGKGATLLLEG